MVYPSGMSDYVTSYALPSPLDPSPHGHVEFQVPGPFTRVLDLADMPGEDGLTLLLLASPEAPTRVLRCCAVRHGAEIPAQVDSASWRGALEVEDEVVHLFAVLEPVEDEGGRFPDTCGHSVLTGGPHGQARMCGLGRAAGIHSETQPGHHAFVALAPEAEARARAATLTRVSSEGAEPLCVAGVPGPGGRRVPCGKPAEAHTHWGGHEFQPSIQHPAPEQTMAEVLDEVIAESTPAAPLVPPDVEALLRSWVRERTLAQNRLAEMERIMRDEAAAVVAEVMGS
jgi:hypothetical protein